ncbi:inner membrane transport permease YbhR [Filimonas sp.]|nr:inner membrane transport permease YbhR [Filimonas sp.]
MQKNNFQFSIFNFQLLTFIKKEFKHVFRDRKTLLMLFGMPTAQIILFGFALTNEIKNTAIGVLDLSKDNVTEQITRKIDQSSYFEIKADLKNEKEIEQAFKESNIRSAIVFPANFAEDLRHINKAQIQIIADASDPNAATSITNYLTNIINEYQTQQKNSTALPMQIMPEVRMLYNPELKGAPNFVPGVIALVLMLVCTMMSSVSIVKEKELGTMEILLVSPFKPIYIIISKLMPFLLISIFNLMVILILSVTLLDMQIKGSLFLLFFASILFILTSLAIGLLISTTAKTQQNAMMISLMGMMLPTMLLTGFMFPIENMPFVLRMLSNIVPSRWFFIIIKNVMLKGLGIGSIWKELLILSAMCFGLLTLSIKKFKIRLQE